VPCLRLRLLAGEQVVEAGVATGSARTLRRRPRAGQIGLEVVELELRGLADQLRGLSASSRPAARSRSGRALLADLGLGDAELVDAVAHDRDGVVEALLA
jgi:hypothetical protein